MINPQNFESKYQYYDNQCIRAIGLIEDATGKMFHELFPELQAQYDEITALKVLPRLQVLTHKIFNELDKIQGV